MKRADQIYAAFRRFHEANPDVWALFERFTYQSIARGRKHYSCDAIFQRIRWHVDIETVGGSLKLNNNFRAYYARMFEAKHPEHEGFFETRKRTSEDEPAQIVDIQEWPGMSPSDESALMSELRAL